MDRVDRGCRFWMIWLQSDENPWCPSRLRTAPLFYHCSTATTSCMVWAFTFAFSIGGADNDRATAGSQWSWWGQLRCKFSWRQAVLACCQRPEHSQIAPIWHGAPNARLWNGGVPVGTSVLTEREQAVSVRRNSRCPCSRAA